MNGKRSMMHYGKFLRIATLGFFFCALTRQASAQTDSAQPQKANNATQARTTRTGDADPFRRYKPSAQSRRKTPTPLPVPPIQERIERYKAQKLAAMNAQLSAPKPTTAL